MIWNPFRRSRSSAAPAPLPASSPAPALARPAASAALPPLVCDLDLSAGMQPFWDRVAATIAACEPRVDLQNPRDCLRSDLHRPRTLESSYAAAVRTVTAGRREVEEPAEQRLPRGRLLVYYPDADLCDGAAEAESGGFFDVFNAPPWDTWVAFIDDPGMPDYLQAQLISWVPDAFIPHAQAGIDVNPEECIVWLDETDSRVARLVSGNHTPSR